MYRLVFLLILFFTSSDSIACKLSPWDPSEWGSNATHIYFGRIASVAFPEFEKDSGDKFSLWTDKDYGTAFLGLLYERDIRFLTHRVMKGKRNSSKLINATIGPCRNRNFLPGAYVALLKVNQSWFVRSNSDFIAELEKSLGGSKK